MKRNLLLSVVMLMFSISLFALSGTCGDNLTWELSNDTLTISGTGGMNDYFYDAPWYSSRKSIANVIINDGVTSIGKCAFSDCSSLTSVTIGNSVTSIGRYAFSYCSSLPVVDNIRYADTYLVEAVDKSFSTYNIKQGTKFIGDDAFRDCSSLTSIEIPNSVTSIGDGAFYGCSSLTEVNITDIAAWCQIEFSSYDYNPLYYAKKLYVNGKLVSDLIIPNGVTSIGDCAFYNCSSLMSIEIPNSVTSIGNRAFSRCCSLTSVTIGNGVTSIGWHAFYGCSSLASIEIPNSVTSIGDGAFYGCSEVETLTLGKALKSIGSTAFSGCKRITDIYCYAERVPDVDTSEDSFKDVSRKAILWVPANRLRNYTTDEYWGQFDVRPMQSDDANTDKVVIKTGDNDAQIIWPKVDGVDSYELTISDMAGNTICTLTFNADGQLQSINFKMPAIDPQSAPEQAQSTGFSFTVTGLDRNTTYKYLIEAKDVSDKVIESYQGQFTTDGNVYDALEDVNAIDIQSARKVIENGRIVIVSPDGKRYGVSGAEIR